MLLTAEVQPNVYEEIYKYAAGPILGAALAYWFGLRGKRREIDNQRTRELNAVLGNMLNSWHYLKKLNELLEFSESKSNDMIFPVEFLPFIVLKSGALNDESFDHLEKSVDTLKYYDPIAYYELEGIGRKFSDIKKNYILPFLQSNSTVRSPGKIISRKFLETLLEDIETHLEKTALLISKKTKNEVRKKLIKDSKKEFEESKEEFNLLYYEIILSSIPENMARPTYEEFKVEFKKPELQEQMRKEMDFVVKEGLDTLVNLMVENPNLRIEDLEKMKLNQNT